MSTAQDLLNVVRHAINPEADVYGVLNEAIRAVGKRLYMLRSSIIISSLSVSVWAEVAATGSDIAFVDSDPDTITSTTTDFTDSDNLFVSGMHITTDAANAGPFKIDTVAANTLTLISTDELTAAAAGDSITITSDNSYGDLPSDFWGLVSYPYLSGKTWNLKPLPSFAVDLAYSSAGIPVYYKIKGNRIYLTPVAGADYTVAGDYFAKPTEITTGTDIIPFSELLDDVICEYVKQYFIAMNKGAAGTLLMPQYLRDEIDLVVSMRDKNSPYHNNKPNDCGVDWGGLN